MTSLSLNSTVHAYPIFLSYNHAVIHSQMESVKNALCPDSVKRFEDLIAPYRVNPINKSEDSEAGLKDYPWEVSNEEMESHKAKVTPKPECTEWPEKWASTCGVMQKSLSNAFNVSIIELIWHFYASNDFSFAYTSVSLIVMDFLCLSLVSFMSCGSGVIYVWYCSLTDRSS